MEPGSLYSIGESSISGANKSILVIDVLMSVAMFFEVEVSFPFICNYKSSPMDMLDDDSHEGVVVSFVIASL